MVFAVGEGKRREGFVVNPKNGGFWCPGAGSTTDTRIFSPPYLIDIT
jgi:hypothetical protein